MGRQRPRLRGYRARLAATLDAFELFEATSERFEFPLEVGDEFGFGGVGFVGRVELCDHLLESFEAGSHVADQERRVVGGHGSDSSWRPVRRSDLANAAE